MFKISPRRKCYLTLGPSQRTVHVPLATDLEGTALACGVCPVSSLPASIGTHTNIGDGGHILVLTQTIDSVLLYHLRFRFRVFVFVFFFNLSF